MEETDEASDEDEEEDDEDDEELEDSLHESHQQSRQQSGLSMAPHPIVEEGSLPSCQHSQQQNSGLQPSGDHQTDALHPPAIMATVEDPCQGKNNMIRADTNGMHPHSHVQGMGPLPIPTHSLHPHPLATGMVPCLLE